MRNELVGVDRQEAPRHGDQGDRGHTDSDRFHPEASTITISREAGSRGRAIGQRLGQRLGWQVYDRELLEFIANDAVAQAELNDELTLAQKEWVEREWRELVAVLGRANAEGFGSLFRVILSLGAKGRVILVGRGAHWILPEDQTLRVRVVGHLEDRVSYLSQTLRLSRNEANQRLKMRDQKRLEFAKTVFGHAIADPIHYDMVLNSSRLGEELCSTLIRETITMKDGFSGRLVSG